MKLLYCIAGTYNSGGMERVLVNKANYLARHGHKIVIATTDQRGRVPFFELDPSIRCVDLNINYEENNGKSLLNKLLKYPFKQLRHRKRLSQLLVQEQPDITISMYCNEAALLPKMRDGSKKVLEVHFSKFKRMQYGRKGLWKVVDWWRSQIDERLVCRYDKFIVLTEEDKGYWGDLPNIDVIPNSISHFPSSPAQLNTHKVLAVGRYTHQKGFDLLLDAWALVVKQCPQWSLDIVGDGELRSELEEKIRHLNLTHSVSLVKVTNQIEQAYQSASCFVMSSRYEGLPMVLIEAQSFGLPIVSFACKCGPRDIITHGDDGYLVEEGDIEALAKHLLYIITNDTLRQSMGRAAQLSATRFDETNVMNKWETLFSSLLNK